MTESELCAFIAAGESFDVEFKGEARRAVSDTGCLSKLVDACERGL